MKFPKNSTSPLKVVGLLPALAAAWALPAQAAVILDGASAWPTMPAFQTMTPASINTERDTGVNRDAGQTFTISAGFQLDAIHVAYQASNPYGDGTLNLRIYPIAAGNVNNSSAPPASSGADVLNVPVILNAATRTAANFTADTTVTSILKFDLTGTDQVFLTPGTYAFQFQESTTTERLFTWEANNGSGGTLYSGGRQFDNLNNLGANSDGTLALTAVPEPSVALLGALGVLGLLRRRRTA